MQVLAEGYLTNFSKPVTWRRIKSEEYRK